jgi:serine phosphatase RsbU (regulator of sigma subunit)
MKSYLLQTDALHDPAMLLYRLNDFLFPYLAGNFVTALYVIYDEEQHTLLYANAGHLDPLLILPSGALTPLSCLKRGIPLGILTYEELQRLGKGYINHTYHFEEGKLLFFTDGLMEAVSQEVHQPYEEILWTLPWQKLASFSAQEIVDAIVENFTSHVQIDQITDDICLLCMEP